MPLEIFKRLFFFGLLSVTWCCNPVQAAANDAEADAVALPPSVQVLKASLSKTEKLELTLKHALELALEANPNIKVSKAVSKQARAQYLTQLAWFLPDLDVSVGNTEYNGTLQTFGNETIRVDRQTFQPQVVFRFNVFQGGRRFFQAKAAKKAWKAQQSSEQASEQQTLTQTALAYYDLKRSLEQVTISQKQWDESKEQFLLNQARAEAGAGTRLDVLQSEAQVARAHQQLLEAVQNSQVAALQLNELLNLPAIVDVLPAETGQQMQTLVASNSEFETLLSEALNRRPDIEALSKRIEALKSSRQLIWSALSPTISIQARTGGVGPKASDTGRFDETGANLTFSFQGLTAPAWGKYMENGAQIQEFQERLEALKNQVQRDLSSTWLRAQTRQAKITAAKAELAATELALSDAMERLKAGVGRNIDVLDAETRLTQARSNLSATILEYNQAQVDLVAQLGLASIETLTQGISSP